MILSSLKGFKTSKSLSPVIKKSDFPFIATSKNLLSFLSLQTDIFSVILIL